MATRQKSSNQSTKSRKNHEHQKNKKQSNSLDPSKIQSCDQSRYAVVDVVFMIVVMAALGFLVSPYVKLLYHGVSRIGRAIISVVKDKVHRTPLVYACIGLSIFLVGWVISRCNGKKCGNPNCHGFRNSKKFDLHFDTDESAQNVSASMRVDCPKQYIHEYLQVHKKELEKKLREFAPENGSIVVVLQARCGCPIGSIEVQAQKKLRRTKK